MIRPNRSLTVGAAFIGLFFTSWASQARSYNPVVAKLHGRATTQQSNDYFGSAVAATENWLLVGDPQNDDKAENAGVAHLYDARSGRYLRKLVADDGATSDFFGSSVALSGNLALVGAPRGDGVVADTGAAYVFNVLTGKQIAKLIAPDGASGDQFGVSVALSGNQALVGDWFHDSNRGAAYVFNAQTGVLVRQLLAPDGVASDFFGFSVALSGSRALVGAFNDDAGRGSAYVLDAVTGDLVAKLTASDRAVGDNFGSSVALSGNRALVGAYGDDGQRGSAYVFDARIDAAPELVKLTATDGAADDQFGANVALSGNLALVGAASDGDLGDYSGSAYVFDTRTGALVTKLTAPDGEADDEFGSSVALSGNRALVGASLDDDMGTDSGAAYLFREVAAALPLASVAQTRSFAPGQGLVEADFRAFGEAAMNRQGEVAFPATLMGSGAGRGAVAKGLWTDEPGSLRLIARGGMDLGGGLRAGAIGRPIFNRDSDLLYLGSLAGTGVTRANDAAILRSNAGGAPTVVLREGGTNAALPGGLAQWGAFRDVVQSHTGAGGNLAAAFTLKPGIGGVDRSSDSGVVAANHDGTVVLALVENSELASQAGVFWGQFAPRVSKTRTEFSFSAALKGAGVTSTNNQGLFQGGLTVWRKGDLAPGTGAGERFSSFVGDVSTLDKTVVYRAVVSGAQQGNNEGLWREDTLVARKGDQPDAANEPGVVYSRFLRFWPVGGGKVIFQATLSGRRVNRSNDVALYLWDNGATQRLLREGENAQTNDGAVIGAVGRVEVEPTNGEYAVLASLTGNKAANLALYTGSASRGNNAARKAARLPGLALRKGTAYDRASGELTRILSLLIGITTDASGAGAKGGPQAIKDDGTLVMTVLLSNGAVELMKGKP